MYTNNVSFRGTSGLKAAQRFLSFETSFVPGLNAVQGLHQAVSGCDAITGERLNGFQRFFGGLAVAGPLLHGAAAVFCGAGERLQVSLGFSKYRRAFKRPDWARCLLVNTAGKGDMECCVVWKDLRQRLRIQAPDCAAGPILARAVG